MKAIVAGTVIAEAEQQDLISIEGNRYFPPAAIRQGSLRPSTTPYTCPWKGAAQYYDVATDDGQAHDAAWCYPHPHRSALDRVGKDFSGYVAFDPRQADIVG
ncbi:DUF427 domain-containing protein [Amycolatopsis sp. FDAARGOS 1241]|uniref:DUF427 domain-containing protein n=1 Tax=Amycolatopsis sp. FDAARGOS 1241 TaxID=2778070 RepID=UPI001950AD03|nr:DUF427 domain-containing protein [Amycolatopsis sp. FDAARGOS 1241]QRP48636.1 DUF427 domain-containing protein [Amycolatopsis sp. FDAARGOS 1241]